MTKRRKFGSKAAQSNVDGQEATPPTTFSDGYLRCKRCFSSQNVYGQPNVPTLMIKEMVLLRSEDKPSIEVGSVIRCGNSECNYIHDVRVFRAAAEYGITKSQMLLAVAGNKGTASFTLAEFRAITPSYNPNAHIEPERKQEELPL